MLPSTRQILGEEHETLASAFRREDAAVGIRKCPSCGARMVADWIVHEGRLRNSLQLEPGAHACRTRVAYACLSETGGHVEGAGHPVPGTPPGPLSGDVACRSYSTPAKGHASIGSSPPRTW